MRTVLIALVLGILVLSGCTEPATPRAQAATVIEAKPVVPAGKAALEGYVVDEAFLPIPHATVEVDGIDRLLRVDEDGYFFTGGIAPGGYVLYAAAEGFESHRQTAVAKADALGLYVFVLRPIPTNEEYAVTVQQRGVLACAVTFSPPGSATDGVKQPAGSAVGLDCGLPAMGKSGRTDNGGGINGLETGDSSRRRWVVDEPRAAWTSANLTTRWTAGHEFIRMFDAEFAVDGCTDTERSFRSKQGVSPLAQQAPASEVERVLRAVQGTTCSAAGERCDADACVLSSRVRPGSHSLATGAVRAGVAFQQSFEQQLVATFQPHGELEGQTLK